MADIKAGDRVYVTDPGLAALRQIMEEATGAAPPNHHGTVDEVDGGMAYIIFDGEDGPATSNCAPYALSEVSPLDPTDDVWSPCTCGPRIEDDTHDECPRAERCYQNWLTGRQHEVDAGDGSYRTWAGG